MNVHGDADQMLLCIYSYNYLPFLSQRKDQAVSVEVNATVEEVSFSASSPLGVLLGCTRFARGRLCMRVVLSTGLPIF